MTTPSYQRLYQSGELQQRAATAMARLQNCRICPRQCRVNRMEDEEGFCRTGRLARVSGYDLHFGEEDPLVDDGGSGTIFFMQCNLACVFCQNWEVSHGHACGLRGTAVTGEDLARIMLDLQEKGAENINLVTPSHVLPQILEALVLAVPHGLALPLVYNTGSYDSPETLALLDGVVDIYLPDVKCWDKETARIYLHAKDYPETAREAVRIMHSQVGDLVVDHQGKARRGVLVRHLVMPGGLSGARHWMPFLASLSPDMYVNVMGQYRPCGQAAKFPELARAVTAEEVQQARQEAVKAGLTRLDDGESRLMEILLQRLSRL